VITVGDLRKLIDGKNDNEEIPLYSQYGDDVVDDVFIRIDEAWAGMASECNGGPGAAPGINIVVSLENSEDDHEICDLCEEPLERGNGDNWDGLCPSCADRVSEYMDKFHFEESGRDRAIAKLKDQDEEDKDQH
jgi:hypothetical protein